MRSKKETSPEPIVREIKRKTRRKFSAEEKIRIILEGLREEKSIAVLCRKEGIHPKQYYKWRKAFFKAGKRKLTGDILREADSDEVNELREENQALKQLVVELSLRNRVLKKTSEGLG